MRELVENERNRQTGHQPGDYRIRNKAGDAAKAEHAEGDLDQAAQGEA
jgi:hypothetical protein